MQHALLSLGISDVIRELMDLKNGVHMKIVKETKLSGHTFETANHICINEQKILIGFKREGKTFIAPPKETILKADDSLLLIYQK